MRHMSRFARRIALTGALAFAAIAPATGSTIHSGLSVEAGQTFELGGGEDGSFTVTGRNTGPVAVEVLSKAQGAGVPTMRGTVAPGGAVEARFASREMALLRNTSATRTAKLKLRITGDTSSLGMSYSDNR